MISWVISAWRWRFAASVRSSISSAALSDALRMALIRAPGEDLLGIRLVDPEGAVVDVLVLAVPVLIVLVVLVLGDHVGLLQREQRLVANLLVDRRDVAVVEDLDAVDLAVHVRGGEPV